MIRLRSTIYRFKALLRGVLLMAPDDHIVGLAKFRVEKEE